MALDRHALLKSLSPKIVSKMISTFDRATTVVVGSCWAAAIVIMIFSIYTLSMVASARRLEVTALAVEPAVPVIAHDPIEKSVMFNLVDRIKHRFPDLTISISNATLKITTPDGTKFRQWQTALSYIEAISPEYQWSVQEFCVGKCKNVLMSASLTAERISFKMPKTDK